MVSIHNSMLKRTESGWHCWKIHSETITEALEKKINGHPSGGLKSSPVRTLHHLRTILTFQSFALIFQKNSLNHLTSRSELELKQQAKSSSVKLIFPLAVYIFTICMKESHVDMPKLMGYKKKSLISQLRMLFCVYSSCPVLILVSFHKMMSWIAKKTLGEQEEAIWN